MATSAGSSSKSAVRPVVVGGKSVHNYALAVTYRLGEGDERVVLRARGRQIGIAFDAANMAINLGVPVLRGDVRWGQEPGPAGKQVSFVEIELVRVPVEFHGKEVC